jgi:actin related protein 2/3 complex subunit 3
MPAYHSQYNKDQSLRVICGMGLMPLKTKYKGPAPRFTGEADQPDIVDEAISFFKANVLFRNFEVKGPADRVLVYLTLYISQCLNSIGSQNKGGAAKNLYNLAIQNFAVPGDRNFALAGFVTNPANRAEADQIRQYLTQLRQECGTRLLDAVYAQNENEPSKWWMCFSKRKFLNMAL